MALFKKNTTNTQPQKNPLETRLDSARSTLIAVVLFSLINIVLVLVNYGSYFLFSTTLPLIALYERVSVGSVLVALLCVGLYFLSLILSYRKPGWLWLALVMFVADTALLFVSFDPEEMILDGVFHAWVLISLISGVLAASKLKKQRAAANRVWEQIVTPDLFSGASRSTVRVNGETVSEEESKD